MTEYPFPVREDGTVLVLRTTDKNGKSFGGFQREIRVGAIIECPDWNPKPVCGGGLHGLLWARGNWSLISNDCEALWWVESVRAEDIVLIDNDKCKYPRSVVEYVGDMASAMTYTMCHPLIISSGDSSRSASSGDSSSSASSGDSSRSASSGDYSRSASSGTDTISAAIGSNCLVMAGKNGCIISTFWDGTRNRAVVGYCGEDGIRENTWYRIIDGKFVEAADETAR